MKDEIQQKGRQKEKKRAAMKKEKKSLEKFFRHEKWFEM